MTKVYDALIIGGGPAGLSTALALGRVHRTCAVFSDSRYRNQGVHAAHAILTRDHTHPQEIRDLGRRDIERYKNTNFVETTVTKISKTRAGEHDQFIAEDEKGQTWQGRALVMATGSKDIFPALPGYSENWPLNIYQCPFCDGHERSGLPAGVLSYPKFDPMVAKLTTMAHYLSVPVDEKPHPNKPSQVTFFTNGPVDESDASTKLALSTCAAHRIAVDTRPVVKLVSASEQEGLYIHLRNEDSSTSSVYLGYILHKPPTEPVAGDLIAQLGLKTSMSMFGSIITTSGPFQSTNIPGVFACGDSSVAVTHVTNAMFTGNVVAAGVAHYCNGLDDAEALARYQERTA